MYTLICLGRDDSHDNKSPSQILGLGIRGTQVKSSIQDIVDEVAPIKKVSLWG